MGNANSGPVREEIRTWCKTQLREVALPKMAAYLKRQPVSAKDWKWCYTAFVAIGRLNATDGGDESGTHERALEMLE